MSETEPHGASALCDCDSGNRGLAPPRELTELQQSLAIGHRCAGTAITQDGFVACELGIDPHGARRQPGEGLNQWKTRAVVINHITARSRRRT